MISALHLLWVVPIAALVGFVFGVVMATNKTDEQRGGLW